MPVAGPLRRGATRLSFVLPTVRQHHLRQAAPPPLASTTTAPRRYASRATTRPRARLQVEVVTLCKRSGKDSAFDETIDSLTKRMSPVLNAQSRWVKAEHASRTVRDLAARAPVVLLDAAAPMPRDSEHFAALLYDALERGGSRMAFVIGDADGLPAGVRELEGVGGQVSSLSLGPLTFTHKMVRLFLYEQLYRATEIRANSKYHK